MAENSDSQKTSPTMRRNSLFIDVETSSCHGIDTKVEALTRTNTTGNMSCKSDGDHLNQYLSSSDRLKKHLFGGRPAAGVIVAPKPIRGSTHGTLISPMSGTLGATNVPIPYAVSEGSEALNKLQQRKSGRSAFTYVRSISSVSCPSTFADENKTRPASMISLGSNTPINSQELYASVSALCLFPDAADSCTNVAISTTINNASLLSPASVTSAGLSEFSMSDISSELTQHRSNISSRMTSGGAVSAEAVSAEAVNSGAVNNQAVSTGTINTRTVVPSRLWKKYELDTIADKDESADTDSDVVSLSSECDSDTGSGSSSDAGPPDLLPTGYLITVIPDAEVPKDSSNALITESLNNLEAEEAADAAGEAD